MTGVSGLTSLTRSLLRHLQFLAKLVAHLVGRLRTGEQLQAAQPQTRKLCIVARRNDSGGTDGRACNERSFQTATDGMQPRVLLSHQAYRIAADVLA